MGPIPYSANGNESVPTACSIVHSDSLIAGWDGALLISAFDAHFGLLADSDRLFSGIRGSRYDQPRLLVFDSGEYETKANSGGQFGLPVENPRSWTLGDFIQTVDNLDRESPILLVNMSLRDQKSYASQISYHLKFFGTRPHLASTVLLRPLRSASFHQFDELSVAVAADLRGFDVIGVTEKELGDSVLDRLISLATLRSILDAADVDSPIHVFGGLDPVFTPLLYAAGAEVFDGLGWLRYSYKNGMPFHRAVGPVMDGQVDVRWPLATASAQLKNLDELRLLEGELQVFASKGGDWSKIRAGNEHLRMTFDRFKAKFGRSD